MGELVDRVARTLLNERGMRRGVPSIGNVEAVVGAKIWAETQDEARAVLKAIREPTRAMIRAGDESQEEDGEPVAVQAQVPWRAMIDEALR